MRQEQRRLDSAQVRDLVAAYLAGVSVPQLSERYEIHRTTVVAHLDRLGVARRGNQCKLTDEDVREAVRLYQRGWSTLRLGQHFNVNPETARKALHRAGLTLRGSRNQPR